MARLTPRLIVTDCGMRLVHVHDRGASAAIFGIIVGAGSADEPAGAYGLAHMVEHNIFKGTMRRRPWHIINRMESIGGELNAYTSKEETVVYTVYPGNNAARAVELVADLCINSQFPTRELDRERQVVLEEIASYLDTPSEAIFDSFEERFFQGSPLAHNILGTRSSVKGITGSDCRRFVEQNYTKARTVAFYSGPQGAATVASLVQRHFCAMPDGTAAMGHTAVAPPPCRFDIAVPRHCHQAHVLSGFATAGLHSDERYAVSLLANMAGGPGMNSLLNVDLRERRGLVYSVEASTAFFSTGGYMGVYLGCDSDDVPLCRRLCADTFARIADGSLLTPRRLTAAKKQYLGQLAVAAENRENTASAAARGALIFGTPVDYATNSEKINAVTADDIARLAGAFADASTLIFN